ncbi:hypothetical protein GH714_043314 [Hevea brasiliensis]|uniref:Uncharacterized protein n=1 Tax=Hevea brasiliensis TaxID=3981 RepID=A0A6A6K315_HEVBR|nr:hypothetical protein GH714_043314 [Hevea brasiliensis]
MLILVKPSLPRVPSSCHVKTDSINRLAPKAWRREKKKALRGAAIACTSARKLNHPSSMLSIPRYLGLSCSVCRVNIDGFFAGFNYSIRAIHEATVDPITTKKQGEEEQPPQNWNIKMLYDGDCPLCMREVMGRIHAILSDGTVVTDVEAFRRLYEQVGLGWVYAITKYEPVATIADAVYRVWAKYRLQITGRPSLEEILDARKKKGEVCNDGSACKISESHATLDREEPSQNHSSSSVNHVFHSRKQSKVSYGKVSSSFTARINEKEKFPVSLFLEINLKLLCSCGADAQDQKTIALKI